MSKSPSETTVQFTDIVDTYEILILALDNYKESQRQLPKSMEMASLDQMDSLREKEKSILRKTFEDWPIPYCGALPGFRQDSRLFVLSESNIVGGVYLCDKHEFDTNTNYGQLHYAFVAPQYKGLGIYSVIFREVIIKAREWGLSHLYLNSDRHMLPEVYLHWGAHRWQTHKKTQPSTLTHSRLFKPFRTLILRIHNQIMMRKLCQ